MFRGVCAAAAGLGLLAAAGGASAQTAGPGSFYGELNYGETGERSGAEIGIGYRFGVQNFRLTPVVGAFVYPSEDDRYRQETFSGGQTVCRDTTNGQFADGELCGPDVRAYGKLEGTYRFANRFEAGLGVRVSDETTAYGTAALLFGRGLAVKVNAGQDYVAGGLALAF